MKQGPSSPKYWQVRLTIAEGSGQGGRVFFFSEMDRRGGRVDGSSSMNAYAVAAAARRMRAAVTGQGGVPATPRVRGKPFARVAFTTGNDFSKNRSSPRGTPNKFGRQKSMEKKTEKRFCADRWVKDRENRWLWGEQTQREGS